MNDKIDSLSKAFNAVSKGEFEYLIDHNLINPDYYYFVDETDDNIREGFIEE